MPTVVFDTIKSLFVPITHLHLTPAPAGIVSGYDASRFLFMNISENSCSAHKEEIEDESCFPVRNASNVFKSRGHSNNEWLYFIENEGHHYEHLPWYIWEFVSFFLIVLFLVFFISANIFIFSIHSLAETENSMRKLI